MRNQQGKKIIILANVGSPNKPNIFSVGKYLTQFLNDKHVVGLPWAIRMALVNFIIIPSRILFSTKNYKKIWTPEGSPLIVNMKNLATKISQLVDDESYHVMSAMRYGSPSIESLITKLKKVEPSEIILFPLYPQSCSATTKTFYDRFNTLTKTWKNKPTTYSIKEYYKNPIFISAYKQLLSNYNMSDFEHVIFSFHGMPIKAIKRDNPNCGCNDCHPPDGEKNLFPICYRASCIESANLLAERMNIPKDSFSIGFQSYHSDYWIKPYTVNLLSGLQQKNIKKILIIMPGFSADCLETLLDIKMKMKSDFENNYQMQIEVAPCLNDSPQWAKAIVEMVHEATSKHKTANKTTVPIASTQNRDKSMMSPNSQPLQAE